MAPRASRWAAAPKGTARRLPESPAGAVTAELGGTNMPTRLYIRRPTMPQFGALDARISAGWSAVNSTSTSPASAPSFNGPP